jgi:hypothetical protein
MTTYMTDARKQDPKKSTQDTPAADSGIAKSLSHRLQEIASYVESLQTHVYLHCRLDEPVDSCSFCTQQRKIEQAIAAGGSAQ